MRNVFQETEKLLIRKIVDPDLNFEQLTDDEYCLIEEKIGDYYTFLCQNFDRHPDIHICGDILDQLARLE